MTQEPLSSKLDGVVEIDECFVGGRRRRKNNPGGGPQQGEEDVQIGNRVWRKKPPVGAPKAIHPHSDKEMVVSLVQRGRNVRSMHIERVTQDNLRPILNEYLAEGVHVMTDSANTLKLDNASQKHDRVNHAAKEYVRYVQPAPGCTQQFATDAEALNFSRAKVLAR